MLYIILLYITLYTLYNIIKKGKKLYYFRFNLRSPALKRASMGISLSETS